MPENTFSLRDIVPILLRTQPEASPPLLARQVRNWTAKGLLKPVNKNTGRGKDREYTLHEIRKAAILAQLGRFGMTSELLDTVADWVDMLEEDQIAGWQAAKEGQWNIQAVFSWTADETMECGLRIVDADLDAARKARKPTGGLIPFSKEFERSHRARVAQTYGHLFIHLTGLFEGLSSEKVGASAMA